jgi:hypothetical protein
VEIGEIEAESAGEMGGNKGNRGFDADGTGGMGSERKCILDVGDPATWRENMELGFMTGEGTSCEGEEVDKEPGRKGTGGD